jgi:hypothetical protein
MAQVHREEIVSLVEKAIGPARSTPSVNRLTAEEQKNRHFIGEARFNNCNTESTPFQAPWDSTLPQYISWHIVDACAEGRTAYQAQALCQPNQAAVLRT